MDDYPYFQLVEFDSQTTIIGRNCGSTLNLATVFTEARRRDFSGIDPDGQLSSETQTLMEIAVSVEKIEAYGITMDELGSRVGPSV